MDSDSDLKNMIHDSDSGKKVRLRFAPVGFGFKIKEVDSDWDSSQKAKFAHH